MQIIVIITTIITDNADERSAKCRWCLECSLQPIITVNNKKQTFCRYYPTTR